jgi:hypothetical protein
MVASALSQGYDQPSSGIGADDRKKSNAIEKDHYMSLPTPRPALSKATAWVISGTLLLNGLTLALARPTFGNLILPQTEGSLGAWNFIIPSFGGLLVAWGLSRVSRSKHVMFAGAVWMVAAVLLGAATYALFAFPDQPDAWFSLALRLSGLYTAIWLLATCQFLVPWSVARCSAPRLPSPFFLLAFYPLGSLFGIIAFAFLFEFFSLATQLLSLTILFTCVGAMALGSAFHLRRIEQRNQIEEAPRFGVSRPTFLHYCRWVGSAALAAALVLGVTTFIGTEISPIPLFWLLPLGLYEVSLVVAFARLTPAPLGVLSWIVQILAIIAWAGLTAWIILLVQAMQGRSDGGVIEMLPVGLYLGSLLVPLLIPHRWTLPAQVGIVGLALTWFGLERGELIMPILPMWRQIWLWLAACAVTWWGCHGDLVQTRPDNQYLFRFIACVLLGVTIGILFMETLAPALWDDPLEFQLVLGLAVLFRLGTAFASHWSWNKG